MTSLKSLNEHLKIAADRLDQAASEIRDLPLNPSKKHIRLIGEALVNIFQIQQLIYKQAPDLEPDYLNKEAPEPDPPLTEEQIALVNKLNKIDIKKIDKALLSNTCEFWRKVARVVGTTMMELPDRVKGIPDVYYAQRVRYLVEEGKLESQGNLSFMGYSEVRLPANKIKDQT